MGAQANWTTISPRLRAVRFGSSAELYESTAPVARGKTRHPWGVWLLGFTVIYPFIWYFKVNKELRDYHPNIDVQPALAVAAVGFGTLLLGIPTIISIVRTCGRIQTAQQIAGSPERCSGLVAVLTAIFAPVYIQSQLNALWRAC